NNFLGGHEALTLTAAGAFKTRELQYYAANYRQVLTGEGLTYFATASYGFGHPGTEELELLNYRTRSFYAETGLSYPVIRARERNLNVRVDFSKMELTLSRLRPLPLLTGLSGLVAIYGQYAMTPLLVSELCGYGGRLFGRGFDPSQFVSDSCIEALFELRYDIPVQF